MSNETKSTPDNRNLETRIQSFRDWMGAALHLLPEDIVEKLIADGFFTAPASTKYHGAYEGGLFDHSLNVTRVLLGLTENNGLVWSRPESPYIIGMFHDICKQSLYRHPISDYCLLSENGTMMVDENRWEHNPNVLLKGHGDRSVMLLSQHLRLTMEEILCIRYHMGAFVEQKEWNEYTTAIRRYPNVLWTHQADMIAAHILERA